MRRNITKSLNDEQRKFAEENISLVYGFISKFNLNLEEWEEAFLEDYCIAIIYYDPSRGCTFSTYLYTSLKHEMFNEIRYKQNKKRTIDKTKGETYFSLDEYVTMDGYDTVPRREAIGNNDKNYLSCEQEDIIKQLKPKLSKREKEVFEMLEQGMERHEITEQLGFTRQRTHKIVQGIRNKWIETEGEVTA